MQAWGGNYVFSILRRGCFPADCRFVIRQNGRPQLAFIPARNQCRPEPAARPGYDNAAGLRASTAPTGKGFANRSARASAPIIAPGPSKLPGTWNHVCRKAVK